MALISCSALREVFGQHELRLTGHACRVAQVAREKRRKQTPGRTRPARPRRCCAAAWLIQVSCTVDKAHDGQSRVINLLSCEMQLMQGVNAESWLRIT